MTTSGDLSSLINWCSKERKKIFNNGSILPILVIIFSVFVQTRAKRNYFKMTGLLIWYREMHVLLVGMPSSFCHVQFFSIKTQACSFLSFHVCQSLNHWKNIDQSCFKNIKNVFYLLYHRLIAGCYVAWIYPFGLWIWKKIHY